MGWQHVQHGTTRMNSTLAGRANLYPEQRIRIKYLNQWTHFIDRLDNPQHHLK